MFFSVLARELEDARRDEQFEQVVQSMQPPCNDGILNSMKENIGKQLKQLNTLLSPRQKSLCLHKIIVTVMEGLKEQGRGTDGDALIPILIDLIAICKPACFASTLLYIRRFRCVPCMLGTEQYTLTTFRAVLQAILGEDILLHQIDLSKQSKITTPSDNDNKPFLQRSASSIAELSTNVFYSVAAMPKSISTAFQNTLLPRKAVNNEMNDKDKVLTPTRLLLLGDAEELAAFEERILGCNDFASLTIYDLQAMFVDYKRLLASLKHNK